eukprot:MONOS_586.1-p1 / transcript=MONOS_586.1 / gene=MONOS_586 / organism=Monocercomonoides_exilis_PA203 / gene_product=unspecified product / transcript_product=unspecified product / location=Mono_scaffold00009:191223-192527(+) / protein_length=435 / sequence_SO=supercontig / SO=protein_coding / is_pseudo=false
MMGEICLRSEGGNMPCFGGMRAIDYLFSASQLGSPVALLLLGDYLYSLGLYRHAGFLYAQVGLQYNAFTQTIAMPQRPKEYMIRYPKGITSPSPMNWVRSLTHWLLSPTIHSIDGDPRGYGKQRAHSTTESDALFKLALMVARGELGVKGGADVLSTPFDPEWKRQQIKERREKARAQRKLERQRAEQVNETNATEAAQSKKEDELLNITVMTEEQEREYLAAHLLQFDVDQPDMLSIITLPSDDFLGEVKKMSKYSSPQISSTLKEGPIRSFLSLFYRPSYSEDELKVRREVVVRLLQMASARSKMPRLLIKIMCFIMCEYYLSSPLRLLTHIHHPRLYHLSWDTVVLCLLSLYFSVYVLKLLRKKRQEPEVPEAEDNNSDNENDTGENEEEQTDHLNVDATEDESNIFSQDETDSPLSAIDTPRRRSSFGGE